MNVETKAHFDRETITGFSRSKNEPEWMLNLRLQGLELFERLPLPKLEKTKIDGWNIQQFIPFKQEPAITELPPVIRDLVGASEKNLIVQKNGSVVFERVSAELSRQGVLFMTLEKALQQHGELVRKYFMTDNVKVDEHKLTALHAAVWSGGIFVYVPKNVEVDVPLQAVFWAAEANAGLVPHVLIVAEANSAVTYVDSSLSSEGCASCIHNGVVEIYAAPGARVRFVSVRTFHESVTDYAFRRAHVERDARVEWVLAEMGGGNTVSDNMTVLKGDGSSVDTKLAAISTGSQKENFTSQVLHIGKHTESHMLAQGVMYDEATAIFNGITKIEKGAEKANGQQSENILMIGEKARGDANPILLIDEDDVKAGHAASVGQIDQVQLYYLMSRGIPRHEAERLIIRGFVSPIVEGVPLAGARAYLEKQIEEKIKSEEQMKR